MANVSARGLRLFHRHQMGEFEFGRPGLSDSIDRQQTQSMASYQRGARLNLTLQIATQRTEAGRMQTWEELQSVVRLTRTTAVQTVTGVPDVFNARKFRAEVTQALGGPFALQAQYGRLSAYQNAPHALERSRLKVMLSMTRDFATPARGAQVNGRVLDHTGRPVAGARVRLGSYTTDTDRQGQYRFSDVPRGEYSVSLDPQYVPADYAWDGRAVTVALGWSSRFTLDLLVSPLNAVHGRVYQDGNNNGRFDDGEGVRGAALHLGERVTGSDPSGAFSFYNVSPGRFVVRLDRNLPAGFEAGSVADAVIDVGDGQPVTGIEFRVTVRTKPIVWEQIPPK
jgi:hypothetical protein